MKSGLTWIVLAIVVIGGAWWLLSSGSGTTSTGPIKIGFIGALTGDAASYGEPQRDALKMAVGDINKSGGISGRQVEIVYEDGKCTGEGGADAAQKLVNVDKVQLILGGSCSSETLAAIPIAEAGKVAIMTGSATTPALINKSPYFSRDYPNDSSQGTVVADAAYTTKGWHKIAVLQESTDYALGIDQAFTARYQALGGTVTTEQFPTSTNDFRSVLSKLKADKPDALFVDVQTAASADRIFDQMQALGWKPHLMVNDVLIGDAPTLASYKAFLEGAIGGNFVLSDNPKLQTLTAEYKATYGTDIRYPTYTSAVYDSLYIAKDAITAIGYNGEKIAAWLRSGAVKDWQGASGTITIGSDGERESGDSVEAVKNGVAVVLGS